MSVSAIHQILVAASPGDAITAAALEIRDLLRQVTDSEIYAYLRDPAIEDEILPLQSFGRAGGSSTRRDLLLFHASIGSPEVFRFIAERPERLVLVYHNISPAELFRPYAPEFAGLLESGRQELAALRSRTTLALADSSFNPRELKDLGYSDVRVSPLIVPMERFTNTVPDEETLLRLKDRPGPNALFVGQVLPHKRPDLLLFAQHVLNTYLDPTASLTLVGPNRLPRFGNMITSLTKELNLQQVELAGAVSPEVLAAHFASADLFVTMSDHEGFCVPLLEAMAYGVPIVARACAAIPETLANAGVLLPEAPDPLLTAECMNEVMHNTKMREHLVAKGSARLQELHPDRARSELLAHLLSVA